MKNVSVNIDDLIIVLEAMRESGGTTHVVFTEIDGWPAIYDPEEEDNIVMFKGADDDSDGAMH